MHHRPASFSPRHRLNTDMGDAPDTPVTAIVRETGEAVRVELMDSGPDGPLLFWSASRPWPYRAEELDGWVDDRDEAGLRPLYDFDGIDRSTPDSEERFEDDYGSLPQWQDDEEAMASVYGRDR